MLISLAFLLLVGFEAPWTDRRLYLGGFFLVSLAAAAIVAHALARDSWLTRVLRRRELVWLGRRSYGVYLFHPPVFLILATFGVIGYPALFVGGALTIVVAGVSYSWVERHFLARKRYYPTPRPTSSVVDVGGIEAPAAGVMIARPSETVG
jgi:peptidoglycan/LPS O-acetylase OafA/YrhL